MAKCSYCNTLILFGGIKDDDLRFCNEKCAEAGYVLTVAAQVPDELVDKTADEVLHGDCPKCDGPGPVEVHTSHTIWSALIMTSYSSHPEICCSTCGTKKRLYGIVYSFFLGWWGVPWGIAGTPIQIGRNLWGLILGVSPDKSYEAMQKIVRVGLATQYLEQEAAQQAAEGVAVLEE